MATYIDILDVFLIPQFQTITHLFSLIFLANVELLLAMLHYIDIIYVGIIAVEEQLNY